MIFKLQKTQGKEKILKEAMGSGGVRGTLTIEEQECKLWWPSHQKPCTCGDIVKVLKEQKPHQP